MPSLDLTPEEWQTLTVVLTKQPWDIANPILYKMARQAGPLMQQTAPAVRPDGEIVQAAQDAIRRAARGDA